MSITQNEHKFNQEVDPKALYRLAHPKEDFENIYTCEAEGDSSAQETPSSNTGVLITEAEETEGLTLDNVFDELKEIGSVSQSLDWLAFTLPSELVETAQKVEKRGCRVDKVLKFIGLPCQHWEDLGHGGLGYRHVIQLDGVGGAKLYIGGQNNTVYISLSASALAFYVNVRQLDWRGFLRYLVDLGVKFRRLDIAFDDKVGYLTYENIKNAVRLWVRRGKGEEVEGDTIVTRFRNIPLLYGDRELGGDGWTFYWGVARSKNGGHRNNSDSIVRIYNKAAEQGVEGTWVRVEGEFRADKADKIGKEWVEHDFSPEYLAGVLCGVIDFREAETCDTNQSRWAQSDWWMAFIGLVERVVVKVEAKVKTVREKADWIRKQAATSLAMVVDVLGERTLEEIVEAGRERLTGKHRAIMEAELALGGL
jgi:phage replication initiation protein